MSVLDWVRQEIDSRAMEILELIPNPEPSFRFVVRIVYRCRSGITRTYDVETQTDLGSLWEVVMQR